MYLVSPDYLNKNERPSQSTTLLQKSPPQKTAHMTRARVKKRKKGPPHSYDKWIAVRGKITNVAVELTALIKAITNFIKAVLPDTTLAQKVATHR
jgi:hypothetical protein